MQVWFNDRIVHIVGIQFERSVVDSFISAAYYDDGEENLTDDELDVLSNENQELIYEEWYDHCIMNAEYAYESDR